MGATQFWVGSNYTTEREDELVWRECKCNMGEAKRAAARDSMPDAWPWGEGWAQSRLEVSNQPVAQARWRRTLHSRAGALRCSCQLAHQASGGHLPKMLGPTAKQARSARSARSAAATGAGVKNGEAQSHAMEEGNRPRQWGWGQHSTHDAHDQAGANRGRGSS